MVAERTNNYNVNAKESGWVSKKGKIFQPNCLNSDFVSARIIAGSNNQLNKDKLPIVTQFSTRILTLNKDNISYFWSLFKYNNLSEFLWQ